MAWKIVEQEERIGKRLVSTRCKRLRYFPIEGKGGCVEGFGKVTFPLFQVVIKDDKGHRLRLKLNGHDGLSFPKFIVKHDDREDFPTIKVGEGKKRRGIPDTLSPKIRIPGMKEEYNAKDFEKRIAQIAGVLVTDEVMTLFANKIADGSARKAA